jgi:hypothetical protein
VAPIFFERRLFMLFKHLVDSIYEKFKRTFVIVHIPTGKYISTRGNLMDMTMTVVYLSTTPAYFSYYIWQRKARKIAIQTMILSLDVYEAVNSSDGNTWIEKLNFDASEFEIVHIKKVDI